MLGSGSVTTRVSAAAGGSAGAPHVSRRATPGRPLGLSKQQPGDQVAREDEEDVDADVAALQVRNPGVREDDKQDGHSPQPLKVVSMRHRPPYGHKRGGRLLRDQDARREDFWARAYMPMAW